MSWCAKERWTHSKFQFCIKYFSFSLWFFKDILSKNIISNCNHGVYPVNALWKPYKNPSKSPTLNIHTQYLVQVWMRVWTTTQSASSILNVTQYTATCTAHMNVCQIPCYILVLAHYILVLTSHNIKSSIKLCMQID